MVTRAYEEWTSRNRFHCGGRFITGPDRAYFYFALALLLLTPSLYWGFSAAYVVHHMHVVLIVIQAYLFLLALSTFFMSSLMDPGIIPRREKPQELDTKKFPLAKPPKGVKVTVGSMEMDSKYCSTCHVFRPPRCSHCSVCNNCVDRFDHHCPWLGNCVARRNYRPYLVFITSSTLLAILTCALCIAELVMRANSSGESGGESLERAIRENPVCVIVGCFAAFAALMIGGLTGFHVFLMCQNATTNEQLKHSFRQQNPFFRGHCLYIIISCFNTLPPSYIDAREVIRDENEDRDSFVPDE